MQRYFTLPAKLNSFKVKEGLRLLPPNIDCFPCTNFFTFLIISLYFSDLYLWPDGLITMSDIISRDFSNQELFTKY